MPSLRTIIVYMAADNDMTDDAWLNIKEMENVFEEKGVNLLVFIDPVNDSPQIRRIGQGGSVRVKNYPEFNSTDSGQMERVLNDIIDMYPASSYGLVLWSHGSSWLPAGTRLRSFGDDHGRQMNIVDLASAIPIRFDFIIFDACRMGAVEVVYELRDKTNYIIASSADIVYSGFPYTLIIPELMQPHPDFSKVAENYFDFYNRLSGDDRTATISVVDTKELERLAIITHRLIAGCDFHASTFDRTSVQRLDLYEEQYAFDFLDFMRNAFPDADINLLKAQLEKAVLFKANTPKIINEYEIRTFCGLSCYIPHPQREDLNAFYQQLAWCLDSGFYQIFNLL